MTSQVKRLPMKKCLTIVKRLDKQIKYFEDSLDRWEKNGMPYLSGLAIPKMMEELAILKGIRGK